MKHFEGFGWLPYASPAELDQEDWHVLTAMRSGGKTYLIVELDSFEGNLISICYTDF